MRWVRNRDLLAFQLILAKQQCLLLHCSMLYRSRAGEELLVLRRVPSAESGLFFGDHLLIRSHCLPCSHSSLVRPFVWRGLSPLNVLWARHHFSRKMLWNMRTSPSSLPPAIAFHSLQSVRLSAWPPGTLLLHRGPALLRLFLSFIFSFFKQKSCSCPFCLEHCGPFPTVDTLKLFTSAVLLAGQCSAVFSSQYPYF